MSSVLQENRAYFQQSCKFETDYQIIYEELNQKIMRQQDEIQPWEELWLAKSEVYIKEESILKPFSVKYKLILS